MSLDLPLSRLLSIDSLLLSDRKSRVFNSFRVWIGLSVFFCKKKDLSVSKSQQLNVGGAD